MCVRREFGEKVDGHWEIGIGEKARQLIPKWMTDSAFCESLTFGPSSRSCVAALMSVREFLDELTLDETASKLSCIVNDRTTGENHEIKSEERADGAVCAKVAQVRKPKRRCKTTGSSKSFQTIDQRAKSTEKRRKQEDK